MKKTILIALILISHNLFAQNTTLEYINSIKDIAIVHAREYCIPASITIAQAIVESSSGKSILATKANNHFGIKCSTGWKGKYFLKNDDKPNECFRSYDNLSQSFEDHSRILITRKHYQFLFNYSSKDYKRWAYGLKKAGYATNPKYAEQLIKCIQRFKLWQYDIY